MSYLEAQVVRIFTSTKFKIKILKKEKEMAEILPLRNL